MLFIATIITIGFLIIASILRKYIKFFSKYFIPTTIIAGVLNMLMINILIYNNYSFDNVDYNFDDFLFNIFYFFLIFIILQSKSNDKAKVGSVIKGSVALGFAGILTMSLAVFLNSLLALIFANQLNNISPLMANIQSTAFIGGPAPAALYGNILEDLGLISDGADFGYTFGSIGFVVVLIIGIPVINVWARQKKINVSNVGSAQNNQRDDNDGIPLLINTFNTLKNSSKISIVVSLLVPCLIMAATMAFIKILVLFFPGLSNAMSFIGVFVSMLFAFLAKKIISKTKIYKYMSSSILNNFASLVGDFMIALSFSGIEFSKIGQNAFMIAMFSIMGVLSVSFSCLFLLGRLKDKDSRIRRLAAFGYFTGTMNTAVALARIVDNKMKSDIYYELSVCTVFLVMFAIPLAVLTVLFVLGIINALVYCLSHLIVSVIYISGFLFATRSKSK